MFLSATHVREKTKKVEPMTSLTFEKNLFCAADRVLKKILVLLFFRISDDFIDFKKKFADLIEMKVYKK